VGKAGPVLTISLTNLAWVFQADNITPTGTVISWVQWVDSEKWVIILDSRALKHKLEVMRLGQVVQNRF
jgi:hypothetical protein